MSRPRADLTSRLATVPQPKNEHIAIVRQNRVANDISCRAERDHDLTNGGVLGRTAEIGKLLDTLQRRKDRAQGTFGRFRIVDVEELADPLQIAGSLQREMDHPSRCGFGRGNSLSVPQLSTLAFTSRSGMASRVRLKFSRRRRSSAISGLPMSTTESSSATASAKTAASSCPRSAASSRSRASVAGSRAMLRRMRFMGEK